jgi:hypothetical protein
MDDEDWRLRGQEEFLLGAHLRWRTWWSSRPPDSVGPWNHDHCDFCMARFSDHPWEGDVPPTRLAGYTTHDGRFWVCPDCLADFKVPFGWVIEEPTT